MALPNPFANIEPFDVEGANFTTPLPLGPAGRVLHGTLGNGLTYYVRCCKKPKARAALRLVIRIGSIVEEEHERGVAHIIEHLAFNASEAYSNHQVVAVLESLGSPFGPCQNAYTSVDETTYELLIPTDKPHILEQALAVFGEFAFKIRCLPGDLEKERGPVMEEWRAGRDAAGRAGEAHWQLMLTGSKYAERLPIGLESVIAGVDAATVRAFYERWYHPSHMAVVAVGDFEDPAAVVSEIARCLGSEGVSGQDAPAPIPAFEWAPHSTPRFSVFTDKETQHTTVYISFKSDSRPHATPADYLEYMKLDFFQSVMNNRLFKVCRQEGAPFYSTSFGSESIVRACSVHHVSISPLEHRVPEAIEAVLLELARVRLYGISARELDIAKAEYMASVEAMYLERDQGYAIDLAGEYVRHFLKGELVVGEEMEARICKTLVGLVTPDDVQAVAQRFRSKCSCVIKVEQFPALTKEAEVAAVVRRVDAREASGDVEPWTQADAPESLLETLPEPGAIVAERTFPALDVTELTLSNGMRVAYKVFLALEDQVLMQGFAAGGLSQVPKEDFRTCGFSAMLAGELGEFGFKPDVIGDILAGKRVAVQPTEGAFWRSISGEQSPHDLETCFQLIYKLFTNKVDAVESELKSVLQMTRQVVEATVRNPMKRFTNHVRFINYGCYYFTPISMADLDKLDVHKACAHFTRAYQNPAEFTLCFAGTIAVEEFRALVERYLASIPPNDDPPPMEPAALTQLPVRFPAKPVIERVDVDMVAPNAQVQITFPVRLERSRAPSEALWVSLCCKLLEQRLLRKLRFESGGVYTCAVSPFFGCEAPSRQGPLRGDIAIAFSCDPAAAARLSEMAMREAEVLQRDGPDDDEVATVLNLEARQHENAIQENDHWLDVMVQAYQSRQYQQTKDIDEVFMKREAARAEMRAEASPATFRDAMRRLLPDPCRSRYTIITMMPVTPLLQRLLLTGAALTRSRVAQSIAVVGAVAVGVFVVLRTWLRAR